MVPMSGRNVVSPFERSRTKTALPFLPLPRSDTSRIAKRSSSVVPTPVEALRVGRVLEHQLVGRLRRADPVEVDLVVLVRRRQLVALLGRRVAAVEEAVAAPRRARHLDPLELVGQRLLRGDLHHAVFLPVRAGSARRRTTAYLPSFDSAKAASRTVPSADHVFGSISTSGVPVEPLLDVEDALVLQAVVLGEEEVLALARRGAVYLG